MSIQRLIERTTIIRYKRKENKAMGYFKVGDRVEVIKSQTEDSCIDHYAPVGLKGTVVYTEPRHLTKQIAVEFDKSFKEGHGCDGKVRGKRGQWYEYDPHSNIYWKNCLKILSKKKNNYY